MAIEPSSGAGTDERSPLKEPRGVRAAETMTTSGGGGNGWVVGWMNVGSWELEGNRKTKLWGKSSKFVVGICTGNTASLRKWFRGLTCGSRSCGGEAAGCFGGGSQHGCV